LLRRWARRKSAFAHPTHLLGIFVLRERVTVRKAIGLASALAALAALAVS
jgi:hypothetical protein